MNRVKKTIFKRCLLFLPTLFMISLLSFFAIYHSPGDAAKLILKERFAEMERGLSAENIERFTREKGLDLSAPALYLRWSQNLLTGDLGVSLVTEEPVAKLLFPAAGKTLLMSIIGLALEWSLALPVGFRAAWREGGIADKVSEIWALISMSTPAYWAGLAVLWLVGGKMRLGFVIGYHGVKSLVIPAVLMALTGAGGSARLVRSKAELVLREGYVRQAVAQGLAPLRIFFGHVLKNALPPLMSAFSLRAAAYLGGSLFMESIFSIPGMGRLMLRAVNMKDFPVFSAGILLTGSLICFVNLLTDIFCIRLDKRGESELYHV
ncbi:MAG: ABC transporter permease [Peptostreptococcaceae bacterium]|nr:ABC transporter permease [Peptostreptococcaceae bacterium]